jgi:HK97 family phage portal protein
VSEGTIRGLSRPGTLRADRIRLADDYTADYGAIWRAQSAVRTVVDFLGRNIAQLGLHQFRRASDTDRKRLTGTGLIRLIDKPNPATTRYRLLDALVRDLGIYDRAYWLKMQATNGPSLLRLPPSMVSPVGESWMWPEAFEFTGSRGKKTYPADQVVHFRGYDPDGDLAGTSPIESLRRILAEEYEAGRMREQTLRNGARASGYLERPTGAPAWSDGARERFRQAWRSQYAGGGPEAGGTPILEDGMKFVSASQTAEQLQYVEARKLTREEVAAAYFIPPPMVGILDHATFSNVKEQHKHLYQDTLGPWLSMIAEELNLQLLADFEDSTNSYLEFNLAEKLRGSFEEQADQLQQAVGGPWMTRNEARATQNMPAVEGGDELIVPLNVITGGQANPQDSAPDTGTLAGPARRTKAAAVRTKADPDADARDTLADVFAAFFRRQRKAVLSAIGAGGAWWDAKRWDKELTKDLYEVAVDISAGMGREQAQALGFDPDAYNVDATLAFLEAFAGKRAGWVNQATRQQLEAVLEDDSEDAPEPSAVFDAAESQRSLAAGAAAGAALAAFSRTEAGRKLAPDTATKTWRVTSSNPRASHAAMDGETVPISEQFSNGMDFPGDTAGGADEVAGCECTVTIDRTEQEE